MTPEAQRFKDQGTAAGFPSPGARSAWRGGVRGGGKPVISDQKSVIRVKRDVLIADY
jgi:hypothetical protein